MSVATIWTIVCGALFVASIVAAVLVVKWALKLGRTLEKIEKKLK